jgi:hypothetical protein
MPLPGLLVAILEGRLAHPLDGILVFDEVVVVFALAWGGQKCLMVLGREAVNFVLISVRKPDGQLSVQRIVPNTINMPAANFCEPIKAMC